MTKPTGWDTGLCQDYHRGLALWFASRLDARHTIRRWFGEQRMTMDNDKLMARLAALPAPDFMHAHKLSDPIGSGASYRANTVVHLIDEAVKAERARCLEIANRHAQMAASMHAGEKARTAWSIAAEIGA